MTGADPDPRVRAEGPVRAEAVVDLAAVSANTAVLLAKARRDRPDAALMAVVKADGYGHGAVPVARAALRGGATALGVATVQEGMQLRAAGLTAPLLAWMWLPSEPIGAALGADVQLALSSLAHLDAVLRAPLPSAAAPPAVFVKVDTGLGRNGAGPADLPRLLDAAAAAERAGRVRVVGVMSHLASADVPGDESVEEQTAAFRRALEAASSAGLRVRWRSLANTPAVLHHPATVYDLPRCGIGIYGVWPDAPAAGLRPAMTLRSSVALVKRVPAGHGVSYGLTHRTASTTSLALVPLGYADGLPRAASSAGEVWLGGRRRRIAGRVAMDQVVVEVADDPVRIGDEVLVFGPGDSGEPTAEEWAASCGTIGYEIVARIGARVPRAYRNAVNPEQAVDPEQATDPQQATDLEQIGAGQ